MAVSFVKTAKSASGGTITGLTAGQLVLVYAFRGGSNSAPSLPAGWTQIDSVTTNSAGSLCARIYATGSSLATGTFTNATNCVFEVYDGVDQTTPTGGHAVATNASSTVSYPALTMSVTDGSSWVAGLGGHRQTNTTIDVAPTGMTNRDSQITTGEVAVHDTNGGVSSWSLTTESVGGTSSGWGCYTVEIIAAGGASNVSVTQVAATLTATGGSNPAVVFASASITQVAATLTATGGTQTVAAASIPTVALNTPTDTATGQSTTPTLAFTGTDSGGQDLTYEIQVDTVNTFDGH